MTWASDMAMELAKAEAARGSGSGVVQVHHFEQAIRVAIEKCAEVAESVDLSIGHGKLWCSDEQAGAEATEIAALAIRKLAEP